MKKTCTLLLALAMVLAFGTGAMAAFNVTVTANSEPITAQTGACEKAGSLTFVFDAGTIIKDGDWWTMDLPQGVTLCRNLDYVIIGTATTSVPSATGGFNGTINAAAVPADAGEELDRGIWKVKDTVSGDGLNGNITVAGTSRMFFRVTGTSGTQRIRLGAYDMDDTTTWNNAANYNGGTTITVSAGAQFQIKILDTKKHDGTEGIAGVWAYKDTDVSTGVGYGIYGEDAGDTLTSGGADWDNAYCISVDGTAYTSQTVNISINSGGVSGSNFLTFLPTNPQIAHRISATAISLAKCKPDEYGYVSLTGGQAGTCTFDYEAATGYCTDVSPNTFTASTVTGNKVLISNTSGTFYNNGDNFKLVLTISGNGAYWGSSSAGVYAYPSGNTTYCNAHAVGAGASGNLTGGAYTITTETGVASTTAATGVGCGTIAAGSQWKTLTSASFSSIDTSNLLEVDLPGVVYSPASFTNGNQVTATVTLQRLPCGTIFTGTRVLAQFVSSCPSATPVTSLLFPYATPFAAASNDGWWFGMSFCNPSSAAGTYTIYVYEDDGDSFSSAGTSLAAGDMVTLSNADLLALTWTTVSSTGGGVMGNTRSHIIVDCNFASAGGFGMMGNGADSTGYVANGQASTLANVRLNKAEWKY